MTDAADGISILLPSNWAGFSSRYPQQLPEPTQTDIRITTVVLGIVRGLVDGREVERRVRALGPPPEGHPDAGIGMLTGVPAAIVARVLAGGTSKGRASSCPSRSYRTRPSCANWPAGVSRSTPRCARPSFERQGGARGDEGRHSSRRRHADEGEAPHPFDPSPIEAKLNISRALDLPLNGVRRLAERAV